VNTAAAAAELHLQLAAVGSPQRAAGEQAYLKSTLHHLGVRVPDIRRIATTFLRRYPALAHDDLFAVAEALWAEPVHERRMAAIELLVASPGLVTSTDLAWIEQHLRACRTWALVDPLAGVVVAGLAARETALVGKVLDQWVGDDDFWIRRSAVLALRSLVRAGRELPRLFAYGDALLADREFFVRKALGWVAREAAAQHPAEVSEWLRRNMGRMNLVTLREPLRRLPDAAELRELYDNRRKASG
jgi:3-methyladenine DNA glycosylase AlkD